MKNFYLFPFRVFLLLCFLAFENISSQLLINPTGDGGFESGTTFAANNWNTAQTGNGREWQVGTAAGAQSPTRAAFVGNSNNYNGISGNKTVHFFRDVAIPAGATNVNLSFYLKQTVVDNTYDYFRVYTTTTANTPQSGVMPGAGYTQRYQNTAAQYNNFTQISPINLTALAGTTVRLVFTFRSDGQNPNANPAVDNISLTYTLPATCPTPAVPTNLQLVAASTTSVNGSFTAPATAPSGFVIIRSTSATAPTISNGTVYNTGTTFGAYFVIRGSNTNDLSTSFSDTGLTANTTYYYYVYSFNNACTGINKPIYSTVLAKSVTTAVATYCIPVVPAANTNIRYVYINKVSFIGTLSDFTNTSTFTPRIPGPTGYQNFTATGPAQQIQGESINIFVSNLGNAGDKRSLYKAWIDLNKDGDFIDPNEMIYDGSGIIQTSTTFGFLIPENLPAGNYRLRIRIVSPYTDLTLDSCTNSVTGETEDYTIQVLEKCVAKITGITNGVHCGTGEVTMSVTTENADFVKWYTTPTGNTLVATTPVNANSSIYSPNLSADQTYYVSAYNTAKNCEYQLRKPVQARVKILPDISFSVSSPEICGDATSLEVSAVGGDQIEYLVDEDFEAGTLGVFTSVKLTGDTSTDNNAHWNNYTSSYQPIFGSWNPVISSGFKGNHFAMSVSDLGTATYKRALELTNPLNTQNFTSLIIKFRVYFSEYYDLAGGTESVIVQGLYNGTWEDLPGLILTADTGNGNNFATVSSTLLPKYLNRTDVKFRIVYNAQFNDGVAVDDVQMFGVKSMLNASFAFNGTSIGIYTDAAGTISYNPGDFVNNVFVKPSVTDIENNESWTITATAILLNGCSAEGDIVIQNNTKVWNNSIGVTDWATATDWKPSIAPAVPTADKCVIIKTPVNIAAATNALAKNIKIETASGATGRLTINGSLTVTDGINNTGTVADVMVKSDGNFVQVNDVAVNSGDLSARRLHTLTTLRKEYNYMSSPVKDQNMKLVYGGVGNNIPFVTVLNEPTNFFINAKASDYLIAGKGFSVKEPIATYTGIPVEGLVFNETEYKGIPNNGLISLPLSYTPNKGYNLAGNPYPSNIDIVDLYNNSTTSLIDPTFRFWDNKVNDIYTQMGGSYQGYSYALFNAVTDTTGFGIAAPGNGTGGPVGTKVPNRVIKVSQAFIVRALGLGAALNFKNSVRKTTNTGTVFFGKTSPYNRYRLQLVKPDGFTVQNGIAYFDAGNQDFGREDTRIPNSQASDALFSYAGDAKVVINGRNTFNTSDVIPLGVRHFEMGSYKIEAVDMEGVFTNGQNIYLKDKQLNILTDLTAGSYTFTSDSGEFTNRFEIVYEAGAVLTTESSTKSSFEVYRDAADFVVNSSTKAIDSIELYDASGKLVLTQKGSNRKDLRFNAEKLVEGMYIVKANLKGGEALTKKIRK